MTAAETTVRPQRSFLTDPTLRSIIYQALLCAAVGLLVYAAISNAADNLARARIATGFGFWNTTAGFDISQTLIEYNSRGSTYGRAFWVGLLNTLLVGGLGIVFATVLGFVIGIARLSSNWLVAKAAAGYVELIRNLPLLLQLLFWYNAVLKALPDTRDSYVVAGSVFLNNRGLTLPKAILQDGSGALAVALIAGLLAAVAYRIWAKRRQALTGKPAPVLRVMAALLMLPPLLYVAFHGFPATFEFPARGRFNITGGVEVLPEFAALLFGLVIYTAAFIAEAVRAGIQAVPNGQVEAAKALGVRPNLALRFVVIPQAMRVIIPPLTSQYLNLVKNSSLAVAVGYPDLVQVFAGTVLNQTGQAVEVIALTMAVYLTISLTASLAMNVYNRLIAPVGERA
ncbi:MAG: amino acid ABC transporter permease [Rhizobiales bacterium]|nr:amino acid ABC transporter permease [Hyphomicrobiales bacterium]